MHMGHNNPTKYFMNVEQVHHPLTEVTEERDLGVLVTNDLKPSMQCAQAAKKAMSILGLIRRIRQWMHGTSGYCSTVMFDLILNIASKCGFHI